MSTEKQAPKLNKAFNRRVIRRGVLLFVLVTVSSFLVLFLYQNTEKTIDVLKEISPLYLIISLLLIGLDLLLGGWRNYIFTRVIEPRISSWDCFRANLANIFMGAVTPGQSGGGLAQMYVLHRKGLKISDNITISFINWISTIVFFPLSGFFAYFILQDSVDNNLVDAVVKYGTIVFSAILGFVCLAMLNPNWIIGGLVRIVRLLRPINDTWSCRIESKLSGLDKKLSDYRARLFELLKTQPQLILYSFLMTMVLYFNKYVLAYVIVLALGFQADFWDIIAIQSLVYFLLYFAPSPGGSGIAELSIASLMAAILTEPYIPTFTLLYRSFLVFIPALIGAFVVLKIISKETIASE